MIAVPAGMRVLVATRPIDFRKGADGLVALVSETLGNDPFSGTVFVFRSKRTDRVKILVWDGSGPGVVLEAAGARCIPVAAGHGRRDSADVGATRRAG
jgi:transposase